MKLVNIEKSENKDAIEMLEEVIEKVKSKNITAVGVSWVTSRGSIGGDMSSGDNNIMMWASLQHNANSFYNDIINKDD